MNAIRPEQDRSRVEALLAQPPDEPWILVPLGNPGEAYADTRHNLGRLMLQRWMDSYCPKPGPIHRFSTGTLYALREPFLALVPGTYMNLSGQPVAEALASGFRLDRMILLHDEKDLPLGTCRLKQNGGDGGHNGVASVVHEAGTDAILRLRLGIGPIQRPLHDFVLQPWSDPEWAALDRMDAPFAAFMQLLAQADGIQKVLSQVNAAAFWETEPASPEP